MVDSYTLGRVALKGDLPNGRPTETWLDDRLLEREQTRWRLPLGSKRRPSYTRVADHRTNQLLERSTGDRHVG